MFFRRAVVIDVAAETAGPRLSGFLASSAGREAARAAISAGRALNAAGVESPDELVATHVQALPVRSWGTRVTIPMQWSVRDRSGASVVVLDADVELAPIAANATQLNFAGSYRPQLMAPEEQLPHPALTKVTDCVAEEFLRRLAEHIAAAGGAPQPDQRT